jgi:hypothetical protein
MLCPRQCEIVAPVPAPHARTADISRLASRRRSYACAAVMNHTNCNAVKQRAKTSNATMISNPAMVLPRKAIFQWNENNLRPAIGMCPGSEMVERLQASHQETQAKPASSDFQSNLSTVSRRPASLPEGAKNDLSDNADNAFACIPAAPAPRSPHRRECRSKIVCRFSDI